MYFQGFIRVLRDRDFLNWFFLGISPKQNNYVNYDKKPNNCPISNPKISKTIIPTIYADCSTKNIKNYVNIWWERIAPNRSPESRQHTKNVVYKKDYQWGCHNNNENPEPRVLVAKIDNTFPIIKYKESNNSNTNCLDKIHNHGKRIIRGLATKCKQYHFQYFSHISFSPLIRHLSLSIFSHPFILKSHQAP